MSVRLSVVAIYISVTSLQHATGRGVWMTDSDPQLN